MGDDYQKLNTKIRFAPLIRERIDTYDYETSKPKYSQLEIPEEYVDFMEYWKNKDFIKSEEGYICLINPINTLELIQSVNVEPSKKKLYDTVTVRAERNPEKTERDFGIMIIDKQVCLEKASEYLIQSYKTLQEIMNESKPYFMELLRLIQFFDFEILADQLVRVQRKVGDSNLIRRNFMVLRQKYLYPKVPTRIYCRYNSEDKSIKLSLSDKNRLVINEKAYKLVNGPSYLTLVTEWLQLKFFKHIYEKQHLDPTFTNISVTDNEVVLENNGTYVFSKKRDYKTGETAPIWLPYLTAHSQTPTSDPTKIMKKANTILKIQSIVDKCISSTMVSVDFCSYAKKKCSDHVEYCIYSPYYPLSSTLFIYESKIVYTIPTHMTIPTSIDVQRCDSERIQKWLSAVVIIFFRECVKTIANSYGANIEYSKIYKPIIITYMNRMIYIEPYRAYEYYIRIIKDSQENQSFNIFWSKIPLSTTKEKLAWVIFGNPNII